MSNNTVTDFDWNDVDSNAQDVVRFSAPVVFWMHGKSEMEEAGGVKFTGGFFFTYEQAGEGADIPDWKESWFKGDKDKIYGLATRTAKIALVRSRRRWFQEIGGRMHYQPWNKYQEGFRAQMQSIGFISGYEAPVCFSFKGMLVSHIEEIVRYHTSKVVALANQTAPQGKKLPAYALWMNVTAGKHSEAGKGNKTHEVTMPELWLPKTINLDLARSLYVGKEQLLRSQALYHELDSWAQEWNQFALADEDTENTDTLGATDRAVEQEVKRTMQPMKNTAVEEDEIPF